jgi:hypothetical protein
MHARHSRSTEWLLKNVEGRLKQRSCKSTLHVSGRINKTVTQDKHVILPPLDNMTMVTHNVSTSSPSVTREVLSNMLVDHNKTMMSQMQQTMEESIDKFFRKLNISSNSPVAHLNQHASNSSATHVPLENTQFNMSLN